VYYFKAFDAKCEAYHNRISVCGAIGGEIGRQMIDDDQDCLLNFIDKDISKQFALLNDVNKDVFQQLLISKGIQKILYAQEKGFLQFESCDAREIIPVGFICLMVPLIYLIAEVTRQGGDSFSSLQLNQISTSLRGLVRLFHRRSPCSCIKDLYYSLKDNKPKMTYCDGCKQLSDAKNIFECGCGKRFYCFRECARRDNANHSKDECAANRLILSWLQMKEETMGMTNSNLSSSDGS
jgi:hypothetical protein